VPAPPGAARRTWPQRLLIAFNVVCILGALGTAGTLAYFNDKLNEVTRIQLGGRALRHEEERPPGAPLNYLLVGADDDTGLSADDPETRGRDDIGGIRTDTIMVLRVDPQDKTARLLSFPRDLWVPIAGTDAKARINEAFQGNDPATRLIETIKQNFGIPIDHYVQVNFASFKKLVDSIDGVPIYFDEPVRAPNAGLSIPTPGCWTLDGTQALAFVRERKAYQVFRDGEWQLDQSGDLGRINRQQYFLQVALKRAIAKGIRNPATLRRLIDIGVESVGIDQQLRPSDLMDLGQRFRNFNPTNLQKYSLPVDDTIRGNAQVLELRADEAHVAPHHVPELRELVEAEAAQDPADRRVAGILGGLVRDPAVDAVPAAGGLPAVLEHRAELHHREVATVPAHPDLAVEDALAQAHPDEDGDQQDQRGQRQQHERRHEPVERRLAEPAVQPGLQRDDPRDGRSGGLVDIHGDRDVVSHR
jgi:LCP family protein required for cell wall assembly